MPEESTSEPPYPGRGIDGAWVVGVVGGFATLLLGLVGIGRSFDYDEGVTYATFVRGGSVWRALTEQLIFNNHQMFSVTQAIAWRLGLVGESAQRMLPVLCGAATVGLLGGWLTRRRGVVAGASAAVVLAVHPVYLAEFRLLRGYALSTLAVLVAALATERSWRDTRRRWLVVAGAAMTIAVTTHAYAVVPIVGVAIATVALGRARRDHLVSWVGAATAAIVIQLPLLDDARRMSEARGTRYRPTFLRVAVESFFGERWLAIVLVVGLAVGGAVALGRRSSRHAVAVAASTGWVALVVLVLWQMVRPLDLYVRFFVSLAPFLAAAVGVGAATIPRRLGLVPVTIVVVLLLPTVDRTLGVDPPIRDAAAVIDAARAAGFEVCASDPEPLAVYTDVPRAIAPAATDGPNSYGTCDVYVAVLGVSGAGRALAEATFADEFRIRGASIFATPQVAPIVAANVP